MRIWPSVGSRSSRRSGARFCLALFFCLSALPFAAGSGAAQEGFLRPLTADEEARYWAAREAVPAERSATAAVPEGALTAKIDEDSRQFIVPRFRVSTTNPAGTTTLFAVRNTRSAPVAVRVDYFTNTGGSQTTETFNLTGFEIQTRNVRDVPGLSSAGGFKTGFIVITAPAGSFLTVDIFQVDPGNNFATGSRAVDVTGLYLCDLWDIRFLAGGVFSGGTNLNLLINDPQGTGAAADPSVVFAISNEEGDPIGLVGFFTNRISTTVSSQEILDAVGPLAPSFGAFEVDFENSTGGVLEAVYDAEGRFSIGLKGACLVP